MEYRHLGNSGLKISALSLGAWATYGAQVGEDDAYACMRTAYEAGVNFFDNAEAYARGEAEVVMGNVIKKAGWKRSDLVISTKIYWGGEGPNDRGLSRKHIVEGTDAALARLQFDYVDLIFCHRPDYHTPIEETVRAMSHVIDQGKAFYWGTSEWSAAEIMEAHAIAVRDRLIPPQMEQPQYNLIRRERVEKEHLPLYAKIGLGTTTWSPLASGLLTGKYNDGIPAGSRLSHESYSFLAERLDTEEGRRDLDDARKVAALAKELSVTPAQLAIAWCLKNPHVSSVITGASRPDQVTENLKALTVAESLTDEVLARIDETLGNEPKQPTDFR